MSLFAYAGLYWFHPCESLNHCVMKKKVGGRLVVEREIERDGDSEMESSTFEENTSVPSLSYIKGIMHFK